MYGDTRAIRRLGQRMADQATEIRADADELVRASDLVLWQGRAAVAMRERMANRAVALRRTAEDHDEAAEALRHHAAEVDRLKDRIRDIAVRFAGLLAEARGRLEALAAQAVDAARSILPEPLDEALASFTPPPRGHRDWLEVPTRFPGVFG